MNQTAFTYLLQHPEAINHEKTEAIKSIVEAYPYFQSARAIYLKGLKNQRSLEYNQALKTTAAYTTDRSILFDFITSEYFIQNEISKSIKENISNINDIDINIEDISINKNLTIDDTLKQQVQDTTGVLDPALFEPKEARQEKESSQTLEPSENKKTKIDNIASKNPTPEAILNLGTPLPFDKKESHSFNEWLKLTQFKPIERETAVEKKPVKNKSTKSLRIEKKFDLIDKFITKNPKINPTKPLSLKGNLAKTQLMQPETLMTETLARIYVEQKNYSKAIQSYKILSLKYPEKSGFFANQIRAVEQLQEQNNKK